MTEISNLYRDFPETRSRCWHTESIYWHLSYIGLLEPFRAISAENPDFGNILVKSPKKYLYYPQVLRTWSSSILKIKQWQNFLYEQYLRCILIFRKKIMFQQRKSKYFKIHFLIPSKTISVKILDFHVFWAKSY